MKIIYRAANPQEAHIVAGMLNAEGIEAYATGGFLQGGMGELPAGDFAVVRVPENQALEAKALVERYDDNAETVAWDASSSELDPSSHATNDNNAWQRVLLFIAALSLALLTGLALF